MKVFKFFLFRHVKKLVYTLVCMSLSDMPTLPIPAGDSRFRSFNLYPAQFLKSCRNSRFFNINTEIFKMTHNLQKLYTEIFNCHLDVLLHFHTFWLTSNSVFIEAQFSDYYQVKSVPLKKIKTFQKRWETIQSQLRRRKKDTV